MLPRILTTHADTNPLVVALRDAGADVVTTALSSAPKAIVAGKWSAFYGNLFGEIKHLLQLQALKRVLKSRGIPYVFWNRDAPWNVGMKLHNRFIIQAWKPVDLYLTHSMQDAAWFSRSAALFPNAANAGYYRDTDLLPLRDPTAYKWDVSFYGALGNTKRRACRERQSFINEFQQRLSARLPTARYRIVDSVHEKLALSEQLALIRGSHINLNIGAMCDLPGNPSWGLPERVFGIPAAGGMLLTDYRRSGEELLPDFCDYSFRDTEDCVEKAVGYLSNFALARQHAESLHRCVMERHTYAHRANKLVELINTYQPR